MLGFLNTCSVWWPYALLWIISSCSRAQAPAAEKEEDDCPFPSIPHIFSENRHVLFMLTQGNPSSCCRLNAPFFSRRAREPTEFWMLQPSASAHEDVSAQSNLKIKSSIYLPGRRDSAGWSPTVEALSTWTLLLGLEKSLQTSRKACAKAEQPSPENEWTALSLRSALQPHLQRAEAPLTRVPFT